MEDQAEKFTPLQKILRYYPQRVQVLIMALMNFGIVITTELGVTLSTTLVGSANALVLALLVFFYGEQKTWSKQHVEDFFRAVGDDEI